MSKTLSKAIRLLVVAMILLLAFAALSFSQQRQYSKKAWSFGVIGDTQWTLGVPDAVVDPQGTNPNFVSDSIAKQIKQRLIEHKVKFAIQMGDSSNWPSSDSYATNAAAAQVLYNKGIGYFPMRGNHDTYGFLVGLDPGLTFCVPDMKDQFPQVLGTAHTFGAKNFSSPEELIPYDPANLYIDKTYYPNNELEGLSYSFDYGSKNYNARFVILDTQWTYCYWLEGAEYPTCPLYVPGQQQQWISERLDKANRGTVQAFVLSHQGLIGTNHPDSMFGSSAGSKTWAQNPFYKSLQDNDIKYFISAHDHLYNRSVVKSPDGLNQVEQIITTGASTKFYHPAALTAYKSRETEVAQELDNVGYYVYTVDGPRVNVDYYADSRGNLQSDYCYPYGAAGTGDCALDPDDGGPDVPGSLFTPRFHFVKKENFGYSLNGREFLVAQGESYAGIEDSFQGSNAAILAGVNGDTAVDGNSRSFVRQVNTGWTASEGNKFGSDILSLWGMNYFGSETSDLYVLSMSYDPGRLHGRRYGNFGYRLSALDANGRWVNAVELNSGRSHRRLVQGPWNPGYGLGTYGVDARTKTVWAVINYIGDFAAIKY